MTILVTGAAGFIGYHVARQLLEQGEQIIGVDSINNYYSQKLKKARLEKLLKNDLFTFYKLNLADNEAVRNELGKFHFSHVVHLAAQAGVRYSIQNPFAYVESNLAGHVSVLELCRHQNSLKHLVYASSSSVYGGNDKVPFSENDKVDQPVSLYAATKKSDELISQSYAHLYNLPQTGLRFFTVYGPWGRPDMALWLFTEAIFNKRPIKVFNYGDMRRDFTYIDDIVQGVLAALRNPPTADSKTPHRVYNLGNNRAEPLLRLIEIIEETLGEKATKIMSPMQPGDVKETYADLSKIKYELGYQPATTIDVGVPLFVEWYKKYHNA